MMTLEPDTEWKLSAKGNHWRRVSGKLLVVGKRKSDGRYWAMHGGTFLSGSYEYLSDAKRAVEKASSSAPRPIGRLIDMLGD